VPFQAVPQGIQVKLLMTQNGVRLENVWNVDYGAGVTPVGLALVGGIFDSWITTDYRPLMNSSVNYDQLICTDISVPNGAQDIRVPTSPSGTNVGTQSGGNVAFVASLRTLATGRNFRGRTYVPGIPQTYIVDAQHVSTSYAGVVNVAFNNLIAALVSGGYALCVLSRYLNTFLRAVGLLTEVISVITDTKIDSQQRRTAN
jgi:hypothetical protein